MGSREAELQPVARPDLSHLRPSRPLNFEDTREGTVNDAQRNHPHEKFTKIVQIPYADGTECLAEGGSGINFLNMIKTFYERQQFSSSVRDSCF